MRHRWTLGLVLAGATFAAGCGEQMQGTSRPLGDVEYPLAFEASRDVLSDYFSIAEADAATGTIRCRPRPIEEPSDRLLSGSQAARHLCRMQLRKQDGGVHGTLSIAIQRQGSEAYLSRRRSDENYRGIPDQTPAQLEGATTPEQNDVWRTVRQDKAMEMRLLGEIREKLHPAGLQPQ
jgi:hypothetical protein